MRCGHATQRVDGAYAGDPPRQLGIHSAKSTPCRTIVVVVPERSSHLAPHPSPHAVEQPTRLPGPANPHPHPHPHNPASHSQSSSSISSSESLTVVTCSRESSGASIAKLVSSSILGDCDACSWQLGLRGARRGVRRRGGAGRGGRHRRRAAPLRADMGDRGRLLTELWCLGPERRGWHTAKGGDRPRRCAGRPRRGHSHLLKHARIACCRAEDGRAMLRHCTCHRLWARARCKVERGGRRGVAHVQALHGW